MEEIIGKIGNWLNEKRVRETIKVFTDDGSQIEGWFKGELMVLFSRLREEGSLKRYEREHRPSASGGKKIDFLLVLNDDRTVLIEVKVGRIRGAGFEAKDYILGWVKKGEYKEGVKSDIEKLSEANPDFGCYAILFAYPPPTGQAWEGWDAAVEKVKKAHEKWQYSGKVETDACLMAVWHRDPCDTLDLVP